jgi:ribosomal protein L35
MPKMKTRQSISKRVSGSATGKLITRHARTSHLKAHKSASDKRRLGIAGQVDSGDRRRIRRALPYLEK